MSATERTITNLRVVQRVWRAAYLAVRPDELPVDTRLGVVRVSHGRKMMGMSEGTNSRPEWTTEPPSVPGHYWCSCDDD